MMRSAFIASWFILLFFLIDSRLQIDRLEDELSQKEESVQVVQGTLNNVTPDKKTVRIQRADQPRSRLFAYLYEINRNGKKIRYRAGELLIDDLTLGKDERFLDLLDMLYESGKLQLIEVPKNPVIREDITIAGFGEEFLRASPDSVWRIRFRE